MAVLSTTNFFVPRRNLSKITQRQRREDKKILTIFSTELEMIQIRSLF